MYKFLHLFLVQLFCVGIVLNNVQSSMMNENGVKNHENYREEWTSILDKENIEEPWLEWSNWSEWSTCSRRCDGGISKQTRVCLINSCKGDDKRYKICNMQPCAHFEDYRAIQCAEFNKVPYNGRLFNWVPSYDPLKICSLTCRGSILDRDLKDFPSFVVQFAAKVKDGTRCSNASLDMCVDGECKRIGCDLKLGSKKKLDKCGVCGGDGSSCIEPIYQWKIVSSDCSVICGGGIKKSTAICRNSETEEQVDDELCNGSMKPDDMQFACNTNQCQPNWFIGNWSNCSVDCGGGIRFRLVECLQEINNTQMKLNWNLCKGRKPETEEYCNEFDCPRWETTAWSQCTESCGTGVQIRQVKCVTISGIESNKCDVKLRPLQRQICYSSISCTDNNENSRQSPVISDKLIGAQIIPSEATFITEDWSKCNVSCGDGFRHRNVNCKIYLEFSQTIAKLPDQQCSGPKPIEYEKCSLEPCAHSTRIDTVRDSAYLAAVSDDKVTFAWKEQGYTTCSASCLIGRQESVIKCVREDTHEIVPDYRCSLESKPESHIKLCNEQPCLPRWNYSDFQSCSQPCGMGIQMRDVSCIHEVSRGNFITVPNNMCPQPQPADRQFCNVLDCPARWQVSGWGKCSKACGGGYKDRRVDCKQVMAQNHVINRPSDQCSLMKPISKKKCNEKPCPKINNEYPSITKSNSSFIQHDVKKEKITLKIGGSANIFYGTTIKIKCPVERGFNRTFIEWLKDGQLLFDGNVSSVKRFRNSKRGGTLRIVHAVYRDSGVYSCRASKSVADINIIIKPRPGEFISSEEIELRRNSDPKKIYTNGVLLVTDEDEEEENNDDNMNSDDRSHEMKTNSKTKSLKSITKKINVQKNVNEDPVWSRSHLTTVSSKMNVTSNYEYSEKILDSSSSAQRPKLLDIFSHLQVSRKLANVLLSNSDDNVETDNQDDNVIVDDDNNNDNNNNGSQTEDNIIVLGKGSVNNLRFFWTVSDWGKCPKRDGNKYCERDLYRTRKVVCKVKFYNITYVVNKNLCEDAKLVEPTYLKLCDKSYCPSWLLGNWSDCNKGNCSSFQKALQQRSVICFDNKTNQILSDYYCLDNLNQSKPPISIQSCYNVKCVAVWKTGNWSKCHVPCHMNGLQYRSLHCIWSETEVSAGNNCEGESRPAVVQSCKSSQCQYNHFECKDKYLTICQTTRLNCANRQFRQLCCKTCQSITN